MKVFVIGGGPAGMMAAATAAKNGADVTLLEGNEKLGKKLYITGKGRCNVTNDVNPADFLDKVITNNKFLYSAISRFSPSDTIAFFNDFGLRLKVERGGRVFPESDHASDITAALAKYLKQNNVKVLLNTKADKIIKTENGFLVDDEYCDKVIVATGGVSYPATGSTGDGYKIAKNFSHNVVQAKPALVPIDLLNFNSKLAGISLKNVKACIIKNNKTIAEEFGEMLFTHTGVSGPIILSLSSRINKLDLKTVKLSIDLKPALTAEQLSLRLLRDFRENLNKDFENYLPLLLPKGLIEEFLNRLNFEGGKKINEITKENRSEIIKNLKNFDYKIKCLKDVSVGIVTSGGVDVKQVDSATMQSKIVGGLYFAGEVLDIDALTGGYNIQIALSTGYLAGLSCT